MSSLSLHISGPHDLSGPAYFCLSLCQCVGIRGQFPWPHRSHTSWPATPWATVTDSRLCKIREKLVFTPLRVLKIRLIKRKRSMHTHTHLCDWFPDKFKTQHKYLPGISTQKYLSTTTNSHTLLWHSYCTMLLSTPSLFRAKQGNRY